MLKGIPTLALIFAALLLVAAAVWLWRHRKERPVVVERLWRFPAFMTLLILPLVYLQPHRPFHLFDYGVFAVMSGFGAATGFIRGAATTLRVDHPTRRLMAGLSGWAVLMLMPVGLMRQYAREHLGMGMEALRHGDVRALIGSLLFALAMIVTHRFTLYRRARRVLSGHAMDRPSGKAAR